MEPAKGTETAARLLGVESIADVANSILDRSLLERGRFEASQFGKNQHSSASAGAVMIGLGEHPSLSLVARNNLFTRGSALLLEDGTLRGHDSDPADGTTSWAISQVLLGLIRMRPGAWRGSGFGAAVKLLLQHQDAAGRWRLRREDDFYDITFGFYGVLLLLKLEGLRCTYLVSDRSDALARSITHLFAIVNDTRTAPIDTVMAHYLLRRLGRSGHLSLENVGQVFDLRHGLIQLLSDPAQFSKIRDKQLQNDTQPRWNSTTWSSLIYPCTREVGGPMAIHNLQIGQRVIKDFVSAEMAWRTPNRADGPGCSWASSLALKSIMLLASDLDARGASALDYSNSAERITSMRMHDVVISFSGPDRPVAKAIRDVLVGEGFSVFYDDDFRHDLLGEDLAVVLQDVYFSRSRYAIAVLSDAFIRSDWAGNWEWRAILARMNQQREGYVLPYFLERVSVPGLNHTIGYLAADKVSPEEFGRVVAQKLRQ